MALQLVKAQRSKAYLKLGMSAPSGGGKTLGALLIAYGLMKEKYPKESDDFIWEKIAIIDTENRSGELYSGVEVANTRIGTYNAVTLTSPFLADKYTEALELCRDSGMEVCIIDSATHLWTGKGGLLEQQSNATKRTGNSFMAWREITPQHNRFIETMLQCPMHVIATIRSKQEYVIEKDERGGNTVRKMGLEPEQRKGIEFEFTTFFEINAEHEAFGSKDRTSIFDQQTFRITPEVGKKLMRWLNDSVDSEPVVVAVASHKVDKQEALTTVKAEIIDLCKSLGGSTNETLMTVVKKYAPKGNPNSITDEESLANLRAELLTLKNKETKE